MNLVLQGRELFSDAPHDRVEFAYAEYKRETARRAVAARPWFIAGRLIGLVDGTGSRSDINHISFKFPEQDEQEALDEQRKAQVFPEITFIGVWDTVDAYGMPIDELKVGIDRYIWPMTCVDRELHQGIRRARHALALDDERPTFRPVLWTQSDELTRLNETPHSPHNLN